MRVVKNEHVDVRPTSVCVPNGKSELGLGIYVSMWVELLIQFKKRRKDGFTVSLKHAPFRSRSIQLPDEGKNRGGNDI